jgi:uncharacterized repeat protein (TIGR03803 family)
MKLARLRNRSSTNTINDMKTSQSNFSSFPCILAVPDDVPRVLPVAQQALAWRGLLALWMLALLASPAARGGVVFNTLHSFGQLPYGAQPGVLVPGNDGHFYGTTQTGGANGKGTVFSISPSGALTTLYSFTGGDDGGEADPGLVLGNDGNFYGTTIRGGTNQSGAIFKITPSGGFSNLYSFPTRTDTAYFPFAALVPGADGNFYGTTASGGVYSNGMVFKMSVTGALTPLYSFTGLLDGAHPWTALAQGSDGNFYGTTAFGGSNDAGTVFKITPSGALTSLYSFTGGSDGDSSYGALVQGSDGNFYGTTPYGGISNLYNGWGTVFRITTNGDLTTLYSFTNVDDGNSPGAALVPDSDGNFYGTTRGGGTNGGGGTLFKMTPSGALTSLFSFPSNSDFDYPTVLALGTDGNFYGTTSGGSIGNGIVFKITPSGALTTLYSFTDPLDGANPYAGLVEGSDGNFYGTTQAGGTSNAYTNAYSGYGTVFRITTNGTLTRLYSFSGANDGSRPSAPLVQGGDSNLYGTTSNNRNSNSSSAFGTVFRVTTNGALTTLYSFTNFNNGDLPNGALEQGSDGNFYGTTQVGGTSSSSSNATSGYGTVFRMNPNGALTSLYSFSDTNDGAYPQCGLVQGSDGSFYGTTQGGGTNSLGTVFKITPNGILTSLYSFTGGSDGARPSAPLVQGGDGNFYGTTENGGTNSFGTVFKITPSGTLTSLYSFSGGSDGAFPQTALVQGSNGSFYGTAPLGGTTNSFGTVFKITPSGAVTILHEFTGGNDGANPYGALVQGSDGNFYGTTSQRGAGGNGTVFQLVITPSVPPLFTAVTRTGGTVSLTWSVQAGEMYQIQYNSDLRSTNWVNLGPVATAAGATLSATDSPGGPQRFYRVVLLNQ